ncbi:flagellar basal-body MS-ring/collar protein FliF [Desulforamulus ruminis]|uniref:Flagellar M-ring protein n=1 Tax=Desulforamulus ruminis (strain ATCC 23193 / DSM 2154 / NCIMB 8452 / DL) TaxID=696281 RepID=F6DNR7_DESRL|nr:flagellar M-ring protein FliF [Desulforamulus ruminis DSM 2154]
MNYKDLLDKLKQRWQGISYNKKVLIILVSAIILAGLIYLVQILTRTNYAMLLGDLEAKDAGEIVAQLESEKIPYKLTNQGKTILVPEEQVDDIRIKLASDGLLTGMGQGYELFDKSKFGATDFEQQVSYQRALQEELRRTITSVEGVEQARVHLVIPQKSVFIEDEGTASASVVIKLKPNAKIQPEQVKGLNDLIVGSVEGLKSENVHIIDTEGNVLNDFLKDPSGTADAGGAFGGSAVERQQQIRRAYEKELESRVQQMLAKVLGPNKAVAMVSAELDFNQQQTNTTEVLQGPIVSERQTEESGSDSGGGGVPSATTQMPGQTITGVTGTGQNDYQKTDEIRNYQHGQRVSAVIQAPGQVVRLSTAVVLDESVKNLDRTQLEDIISAAIGFNEQRGDQITVSAMTFDRSDLELAQELEKETQQQNINDLYMMVGAASAGLLILLLLLGLYLRRRRRKARLAEVGEPAGIPITDMEPEEEAPAPKWELPPARDKHKELKEIAEERPEDLAQVLKVWLRE